MEGLEGLTINNDRKVAAPCDQCNDYNGPTSVPDGDARSTMSARIRKGSSWRKDAEDVHAKHNQERSGGDGYEAGGLEKGEQDRFRRPKSIGVLTN